MGFVQNMTSAMSNFAQAGEYWQEGINSRNAYNANADKLRKQSEANIRDTQTLLRTQRNEANSLLSKQRANWNASGVAPGGTSFVNEVSLASKLEQQIAERAHKALTESKWMDYDAQLSEWQGMKAQVDARNKSKRSIYEGIGNTAQAAKSLF